MWIGLLGVARLLYQPPSRPLCTSLLLASVSHSEVAGKITFYRNIPKMGVISLIKHLDWLQLGGKGANLAEMASIGLSVPPGLTISTEACNEYQQNGKKLPPGLWDEILEGLQYVQNEMGASLGDPSKPLLLSVRSGAAVHIYFFCNPFITYCIYPLCTYLCIK